MESGFLGRGWSFPPEFRDQGRGLAMVEGEEDVRQSLIILLSTRLGERVMVPTYGWRRESAVFQPLSTSLATLLRREVETAVLFYEPRVRLNGVTFVQLENREGVIEMRLDYTVRSTNNRTNLVYPFYLDEATNA